MTEKCALVRDLLPLYQEGMVRPETADFVRAHLALCPDCAAASAADAANQPIPAPEASKDGELDENVLRTLKLLRKKQQRKLLRATAVIAAVLLAATILLQLFPVYRLRQLAPMGSYYSREEIAMALSIGTAADRAEAQSVLRLADEAFNDTRHTHAENEAAYGLLARYATATDSYGDTSFNEHSLELWSAHLGDDEGWLWVYYSSETFHHDGSTACGSWNIPSLWKVERDDSGAWVVTAIREHA